MRKSITLRLIVYILAAVLPLILGTSFLAYKYSSSMLMQKTNSQAQLILENAQNQIKMRISPVEKIPMNLASGLPEDPQSLENKMITTVEKNTDIFGMAAAFEPFQFNSTKMSYCPYVYNKNGEVILSHLDSTDYDYMHQDWYAKPKSKHEAVWSEPYYDEGGGNVLMSTYSYPIYIDSAFKGVLTVDITLSDLQEVISGISVLETGYAFLISADGKVMVSQDKNILRHKQLQSADISTRFETDSSVIWAKRVKKTGWLVGILFPKDELFAPIKKLNFTLMVLNIFCGLLLILLVSTISRKVTGGMESLTEAAETISAGNFNTLMPVFKGEDELAKLSTSFETMRKSIIEYMENLRKTESEKQKIESELSIAREIQQSILPKIFPPFPERDDVDIYAYMKPAREVGGDMYDFYFLDENLLCFLIGDVSGKGVPASLFMAVAKTLVKAIADKDTSAGDVFTKVNTELAKGNDSCMFVTAFIGIMNLQTGDMHYANAGHNPPAVITRDEITLINSSLRPPLGAFEGVEYETYTMKISDKEKILLYTDGITEAMDKNRKLYSDERLIELLRSNTTLSVTETLKTIVADVNNFADGADQHDDITAMCISRTKTS